MGRNYPHGIRVTNGHHSLRGINKLVAIVKVQCHQLSRNVVLRKRNDLGLAIAEAFERRALAFSRHKLSEYRKYACVYNDSLENEEEIVNACWDSDLFNS